MEAKRRYLKIFLSTLYLSAFTFGGGYVIVSLLRKKFVEELHWIDQEEMLDLVAIAQSSPGAIAVNGAIVVGYRLGGFPGILCAVLGAVIPPFVILTLVSMFYGAFRDHPAVQALLRGMKSGVAAVIMSVVWDMAAGLVGDRDRISVFIMLAAFAASYFLKINVVWIILVTAAFGAVHTLLRERKGAKK